MTNPSASLPRHRASGTSLLVGLVLWAASACAEGEPPAPSLEDDNEGGLVVLAPEPEPGSLPPPPLVDDPPERPYFHDFGTIEDGDKVRHSFRIQNVESVPIGIVSIKPSCGCTVPSLHYTDATGARVESRNLSNAEDAQGPLIRIPPGVEASLDVAIDSHDVRTKNVDKLMTIIVETDHEASYYLRFEVHLIVENPFQIAPGEVRLGSFARSAGKKATVDIVPIMDPNIRVTGITETSPPGLVATLSETDRLGRRVWVVEAGFDPPVEPGTVRGHVEVAVERGNGESARPIRIPVVGAAVNDIQSNPARLILVAGRDREDAFGAEVSIASLLPGHRLRIVQASVSPEHEDRLRTDLKPEEADAAGFSRRWTVRVETTGPLQEAVLNGELVLQLDDPQNPLVRVPYVIHTR